MGLFVTLADEMYGPITTLQHDNRLMKHIPWLAFKMVESDWMRVIDAHDILAVELFFHFAKRGSNEIH